MKQQGFSVVELLLVVAAVAILAAFLVPNYLSSRQRAEERAAEATASSLLSAISAYHMASECYPPDVGPDTMPQGLAPYVGGQWPAGFDYEQWGNSIGVSWRPGGAYRWTRWLTQGVQVSVCP